MPEPASADATQRIGLEEWGNRTESNLFRKKKKSGHGRSLPCS
jgi:hypothetical protein